METSTWPKFNTFPVQFCDLIVRGPENNGFWIVIQRIHPAKIVNGCHSEDYLDAGDVDQ
jgi:hypothetical protein